MRRTLLGLAVVATVMGATVARADDNRGWWNRQGRHEMRERQERNERWEHQRWEHERWRDGRGYVPQQQGRYVQQQTQQWVPGRYDQVYVAPICDAWGRCTDGGYQSIWVPGRYETQVQWVWVAEPSYPHAAVGVRFGF